MGTGVGAGAGRLLGPSLLTWLSAPQDWSSPLQRDRARLAHLLRRATFGLSAENFDRAQHEGYARTLDRLLETPPVEPPNPIQQDDPARGAMLDVGELQQWWLRHMLTTPSPFAERMTYFWHGHFTTSADKAGSPFVYWQNLTWRRMALGSLGDMLRQVTIDPAMLDYLDLAQSDASDPSQPPNENYARELLELFTMGPGNYGEGDVKAAAKALAGWTTPPPDRQVDVIADEAGTTYQVDVWDQPATGLFAPEAAFDGEVTFLGRKGRMGLPEVVDMVLRRPATAAFIARRVAVHFVSPAPAPATVRELADAFRRGGYQVRDLMRAAFRCAEFTAPKSYRSLVRSPVDHMVAATIAVAGPAGDSARLMAGYGEPAGQALFAPPNVAGWPPNAAWISPGMLLARFGFVSELLGDRQDLPPAANAIAEQLEGNLGPSTQRRFDQATSERERWLVILTSPEFHLK